MRVLPLMFSFTAVLILTGCRKEKPIGPEPVPVKAEMVSTQEIRPAWRYSGEIRPDTEVQLAFKEPGYIAALHQVRGADGRLRDIQVGDEIPSGTVLAHLRRSDYEASLNTAVGQEQSTQGALRLRKHNSIRPKPTRQKRIWILSVPRRCMPRRP